MTSKKKKTANKEVRSIEDVPIDAIVPYAMNAKMHSQQQIAAVAGSIKEFGFCNPVLLDKEGTIIAGHCRVLAAQVLGRETVPCIRLLHLTDDQRRAYIIADNRLSEVGASWDYDMLRLEMESIDFSKFDGLKAEDFSFPVMGSEKTGGTPEKDEELPDPGITGEDDRTGSIVLLYDNDSERQLWADRIGIDGDKVVYTFDDIKGEAGE